MATKKTRRTASPKTAKRKTASTGNKSRKRVAAAGRKSRAKTQQATQQVTSPRSRTREIMVAATRMAVTTARKTSQWVQEAGEYVSNHNGRELYQAGKSALNNVRMRRPIRRAISLTSELPARVKDFRERKKLRKTGS